MPVIYTEGDKINVTAEAYAAAQQMFKHKKNMKMFNSLCAGGALDLVCRENNEQFGIAQTDRYSPADGLVKVNNFCDSIDYKGKHMHASTITISFKEVEHAYDLYLNNKGIELVIFEYPENGIGDATFLGCINTIELIDNCNLTQSKFNNDYFFFINQVKLRKTFTIA